MWYLEMTDFMHNLISEGIVRVLSMVLVMVVCLVSVARSPRRDPISQFISFFVLNDHVHRYACTCQGCTRCVCIHLVQHHESIKSVIYHGKKVELEIK